MKKNTLKIIALLLFKTLFVFSHDIEVNQTNEVRPVVKVKLLLNLNQQSVSAVSALKYLAVYMIVNDSLFRTPLSGNYLYKNSELSFTPHNNLGRGLEFEIQFYKNRDTIRKRFKIPEIDYKDVPETVVTEFYPVETEIPGNILRFHIQFSNPMQEDERAFLNVKVLDNKGEEIKMIWRHKSHWVNKNILVMMIHPGRVKRGLGLYAELGEAFEVDKEYEIIVTTEIKDVYGRKLPREFSRKYTIGPPDRFIPKVIYEKISVPKKGTNEALKIVFNDCMDFVSIIEGISIIDSNTMQEFNGIFRMADNDSTWLFTPNEIWKNNSYELILKKELTDLANNHLHRLFEITSLDELNEDKMPMRWGFNPK